MKRWQHGVLIGAIILVTAIIVYMNNRPAAEGPVDNTDPLLDRANLETTVGRREDQSLADYIRLRKRDLQRFSESSPDELLVGMVSFTERLTPDQATSIFKDSKVTPVAIEFSFGYGSKALTGEEIRVGSLSIKDAWQTAMDSRLERKNKTADSSLHGIGGSAEMQAKIRQDMMKLYEAEERDIRSGRPVIYGLLVTGRASEAVRLLDNEKVRLVDALTLDEGDIKNVPPDIRTRLQPIKPEEE